MNTEIKPLNALFKYKWVILISFLVFMGLSADSINYVKTVYRVNPTVYEVILEQTNEPQMILFSMMYLLLLVSMGGQAGSMNKKMPFELFKDAFRSIIVYMLLFISANVLYSLINLNINSIFSNIWSYESLLSATGLSPLGATSISIAMLFMRYCFILFLINFINTLTRNNHWGFWIAFIFTYIDYMLYRLLYVPYPLGILPLEHTRITYTEAYVPDFNHFGIRIPYYFSVLYWVGLTLVVYIGLMFVKRRRRKV